MSTAFQDTGLATRTEESRELSIASATEAARADIESAIVVARRFPRNEDAAFEKLMHSCKRPSFAEDASYSFPRGGATVYGPSVRLAREAARVWQNIRYGLDIVRDDTQNRQVRGWAYDVETNVRVAAEDSFQKLIYRKGKGWVEPDERDLRELTNRRGAILVRNCILQLLPSDLIEDALNEATKTLEKGVAKDPDAARKAMIAAFSDLGVTVSDLEALVGKALSKCSPAEITELRGIYQSIRDGNSTWSDYVAVVEEEEPKTAKKQKTLDDVMK